MSHPSREIHLAARPVGEPQAADFRLAQVEVPDPGPGEVLVRNQWMSVDPYMRGRMRDARSYVTPFELGEPLEGGAVGQVVASGDERFDAGQTVRHQLGWREYALVPADQLRAVDTDLAPASAYLGVLGMPGLTAYAGLLDVAELRSGDVVFVSAAAGAVGSLVGQIARIKGCRVIGSAGSADKVAYLKDELRFDEAFNYRDGSVDQLLSAAAPDGIDVYFDNVGGDHLEAAIGCMKELGRVALCGAVSVYNATSAPPGPRNLPLAIGRRLTLRGFIVTDHAARYPDFVRDVSGWLREGEITYRETVVEGIERAPDAFIGLLQGKNLGKMVVKF
ncbi:MAG: NADP-dependent oxidoreductase [Solirubrobacteraceae bacterium]